MTMPATVVRQGARPRANAAAAVVAATGCGVLAARPALLAGAERPVTVLVALFVVLLVVGALFPLPLADVPGRAGRAFRPTLALGVFAFAAGRVLVGGHAPARLAVPVVLANALAAVAEEAWFRRLCFGLLAPAGSGIAILGSTVLFALVHVSIYGFWILPLDLAAGALFGWQRAVTGSWAAPAVTHVVANVLVLL